MPQHKAYFLTSNKHKFEEVKPIFDEYGIELVMLPYEKVEVQGSLEQVAVVAAAIAYSLPKPLLVEDAGLFVEALNGFPGPYSSYVYKTIGWKGILKLMEGVKNRRAYFKAVVACFHKGIRVFEGVVEGEIAEEGRGNKGFGFDPIFIPKGYNKTFAEMGVEEKSKISHRGKAFRKAAEAIVKGCQ